jgi:catechol 2,3-dioxygenase-like lactoylglutathione lyase family enzyme
VEDFYPMPLFINLEVADLSSSAEWYRKALGFRIVYSRPPGAPALIHLRRERYQDILLIPSHEDRPLQSGKGIVIQIQAGSVGVEEIARQAKVAGTLHVEGPVERPGRVPVAILGADRYYQEL